MREPRALPVLPATPPPMPPAQASDPVVSPAPRLFPAALPPRVPRLFPAAGGNAVRSGPPPRTVA